MKTPGMDTARLPHQGQTFSAGSWIGWGVLAANALLSFIALLLAVRRLSGALIQPLDALPLGAIGLILAVGVWTIRAVWHSRCQTSFPGWPNTTVQWTPSIAIVLAASALSVRGSSPIGLAALWTFVACGEIWMWRPVGLRRGMATGRKSPRDELPRTHSDDHPHSTVLQQLTRIRDEQGRDLLKGTLRAELEVGERSASVHVAFCPPFETMPQLAVHQTGGPEAQVSPAQVYPYGARVDVRLGMVASQLTSVVLELEVRDG